MSKRQAAIRRLLADLSRVRHTGVRASDGSDREPLASGTPRTGGSAPSATTSLRRRLPRRSPRRPDAWYVGEWSRLAGTILGEAPAGDPPLDATRAPETIKQAARQRAQAAFADAIARGERLEGAVYRSVADLTGRARMARGVVAG